MTLPLPTRADELRALAELRARMHAEGLDRQSPALALAVLGLHVALMAGGLAAFLLAEGWWIRAIGLLVSTYGTLGIGMTAHNASHAAVTGWKRFDRALTHLTATAIIGVSASYWWKKHVRLHHAGPNHVGLDSDIELMPVFALSAEERAAARGWRARLYRVQHWIFPFAVGLNLLNLKLHGVRHLVAELRSARRGRAALWADMGCLCVHLAAFVLVPALVWPLGQVLALYLLREILNGYALFAAAAPAHFPAEACFVRSERGGRGLLAGQIHTTVSFRTGFLGRLVCLGAEYQIEHHLLPDANPLRMRRVSVLVQEFCRRHGYPYRRFGWGHGIVKALASVREPKRIHALDDLVLGGARSGSAEA